MQFLSETEIEERIVHGLDTLSLTDKRVLVLIPDRTRTLPMPLFFRLVVKHLRPKVREVAFLIARGTHPPMSEDAILKMLGLTSSERNGLYGDVQVFNHSW